MRKSLTTKATAAIAAAAMLTSMAGCGASNEAPASTDTQAPATTEPSCVNGWTMPLKTMQLSFLTPPMRASYPTAVSPTPSMR